MDNLGPGTFVGDDDVHFDFQPCLEWGGAEDQRSVAIDDNSLTITGQWVTDTVTTNQSCKGNTSTSTRFANAPLKRQVNYFVGVRCRTERLACGADNRRCPGAMKIPAISFERALVQR